MSLGETIYSLLSQLVPPSTQARSFKGCIMLPTGYNHYSVDSIVHFANTYLLDEVIYPVDCIIHPLNNWYQEYKRVLFSKVNSWGIDSAILDCHRVSKTNIEVRKTTYFKFVMLLVHSGVY